MCRIILLLLSFLCIPFSSLASEPAKQFTLKEAIFIALRFNADVRSSELQRIVDKFDLEVAKNKYELHYALKGSSQYNDKRINNLDSHDKSLALTPSTSLLVPSGANISLEMDNRLDNRYYNPELTLTVKQPLLKGFGTEITLNPLAKAYDQEKLNRLTLKRTLINTITTIVSDYLRIVQAENNLTTQELALKDSLKEYQQNIIKIKAGKMAAADNIQQQASIAEQRLALLQMQTNLKQNKQQLLLDMGLDPTTDFSIVKTIDLSTITLPTRAMATQLILKNDIDYQVNLINRRNQSRALAVAKDNLRWELNLTTKVSVGHGSGGGPNAGLTSLTNQQNQGRSIQLDLSVPIDDKELQQSVISANIELQKLDIQLQQQKYSLEDKVINALRNLHTRQQQIEQALTARDLAQRSLAVALKKLQYGLVSTFETTTLRSNLINAEIRVVNNRIDYFDELVKLQQTLGTTLDVWAININD